MVSLYSSTVYDHALPRTALNSLVSRDQSPVSAQGIRVIEPALLPTDMSLLSAFVTRPASQWVEAARGTVGGVTWGPSLKVAKWAVHSLFSNVKIGTLVLLDEVDGTSHVYGETWGGAKMPCKVVNGEGKLGAAPRVHLVVKKSAFWMRLLLFADMGFSEAYMLGEVDCNDLTAFFQV